MTGHQRAGALGLHTDLYELRMAESYLRAGMTAAATFSLFIRPSRERPWYVAMGAQRACEVIASFRYGPDELAYLRTLGFGDDTLDGLGSLEPSGEVWAVPDGTVVLADEPLVEVTAPLPFAQLVETAVMNVVHQATLVATKAARVALAARDRTVVEFGFRRAHGLETGVEASLAAYVGGGMATSNVEAGRRYGIDVAGTMAHSFVQAFDDELDAFRTFSADHTATTLLVDTYDTLEGVRKAIAVADELRERGGRIGSVRLDSGDLAVLARETRRMLDEAGHPGIAIFASGGLDEYDIHGLVSEDVPIDAFGVGTTLVTSSDKPGLDIAYKLVSYDGVPRAKSSEGKASMPGAKQVFRRDGPGDDVLGLRDERLDGQPLLRPVWRDGSAMGPMDPEGARRRAVESLAGLPEAWRVPPYVPEPPTPKLSERLEAATAHARRGAR